VVSGFHHRVVENCVLLGYYAASSGNFLPMFWGNVWIPSSRMGSIGCTKASIRNYHYLLHNNPEEYSSHNAEFLSTV